MFGLLLATALTLQTPKHDAEVVQIASIVQPPPPEQVLAIPDGLRSEFKRKVLDTKSPEQRLYKLVDFMLKPDGLGLKYKSDATNTVTESYSSRQVNCMAFTMMAVALAREAGLSAYAQQIDRVMAWNLTDDVVTQSLHANAVVTVGTRKYMLDIAVGTLAAPVVDYRIDDEHLLALFYGNRAMELLATGHLSEAMTWQEQALRHNQRDATLLNNAGVLRQRLGDTSGAEKLYLKAVEASPSLTSTLANLIALYRQRGDIRQTYFWQRQANNILRRDPYYQFAQGRRDEAEGNYQGAIGYYQRAISLYKREHIFHFSLARAYYRLGRLRDADFELGIAQQISSDGADRQRYKAKREALSRMVY